MLCVRSAANPGLKPTRTSVGVNRLDTLPTWCQVVPVDRVARTQDLARPLPPLRERTQRLPRLPPPPADRRRHVPLLLRRRKLGRRTPCPDRAGNRAGRVEGHDPSLAAEVLALAGRHLVVVEHEPVRVGRALVLLDRGSAALARLDDVVPDD